MKAITITLPWPPSINSMYQQGIIGGVHKKARASMFLSAKGKEYRLLALEAISVQRVPKNALKGRLKVAAIAYPPDARIRDLDNLWKSALDVLKHNQVITDDGHIDDLHVRRAAQVNGGSFVITVSEIEEAFDSRPLDLFHPADQRILDAFHSTSPPPGGPLDLKKLREAKARLLSSKPPF